MEKADSYNLDSYEVTIKEKDGRFYCMIPDLAIVTSGESPDEAYRKLADSKQQILKEYTEAGTLSLLPAPTSQGQRRQLELGIKGIAIKTLLVVGILGAGIFVTGVGVNYLVQTSVQKIEAVVSKSIERERKFVETASDRAIVKLRRHAQKYLSAHAILKILEDKIIKASQPENDISPEDREEIRKSLRRLVERFKPFADELHPLFTGPEKPAGK